MKKSIFSIVLSIIMLCSQLPVTVLAAEPDISVVNDEAQISDGGEGKLDNWQGVIESQDPTITLSSSVSISAGTYDLTGKTVTFEGTANIEGNVTITGGTILRGSSNKSALFEVSEGDLLTLKHITVDGQKDTVTASNPLVDISTGGGVILEKGSILTNNKCSTNGEGSAVTVYEGELTIAGGKITQNLCAASSGGTTIKTYYGAKVIMTSGEISENKNSNHGGAIQLYGRGYSDENRSSLTTFTMSGGTICNNTASGVGGGVAVSAEAKFIMSGGTITGNSCGSSRTGGGVAFSESDSNNISMEVSGSAKITGNTKNGIANNLEIGTANLLKVTGALSGANIGITTSRTNAFTTSEEGIVPATYINQFASDKTSYHVEDDGNNQLLLRQTSDTITINTDLVNENVAEGGTLTVLASANNAQVVYQWYSCTENDKSGAQPIPGATQNTYTIPTGLTIGEHYYFCRISAEGAASVDSRVVNVSIEGIQYVSKPMITEGCIFSSTQEISITCDTVNVNIYYTLNGTEPNDASYAYNGPFTIIDSAVVRAIAICRGGSGQKSEVAQQVFELENDDDFKKRIEKFELTNEVITEELKTLGIDTNDEVEGKLKEKIGFKDDGAYEDNVEVMDVKLQFSLDDGRSWIDATEENFPTAGITTTLSYPSGTGKETHDFFVTHMFTKTSNRLGTTAGYVETPAVTETEEGIQVTLMGLSPVAIGYKVTSSGGNGNGNITPPSTNTGGGGGNITPSTPDSSGGSADSTTTPTKTSGESVSSLATNKGDEATAVIPGIVSGGNKKNQTHESVDVKDSESLLSSSMIINVIVNPTTADVSRDSTKQFTATVRGNGNYNKSVKWSVSGQNSIDTKIDADGLLSIGADETATTIEVKATAVSDISKFGTATVTIQDEKSIESTPMIVETEEEEQGCCFICWLILLLLILISIQVVRYLQKRRKEKESE